jgi:hypothetical protein
MEGIFIRKKFIGPLGFMSICSIFLIGLYFFLPIINPEATKGSLSFFMMGVLLALVTIPSWTLNRGAFFHITEDAIRAKYHWFGKINCKLSDVTFVFPQINTLTICLKGGKYYTIMGISNSWQVASFISHRISFEVKDPPEALIKKLDQSKRSKTQYLIRCSIATAFMLITPFITLFLTEEKSMHEFTRADWIITAVMGIILIFSTVDAFRFANKTGKMNIPLEKLHDEIRRTVIETEPLIYGNAIKVFINEDANMRLTVFGYPNSDSVYYTIEQLFPDNFSLCKTHESPLINIAELPESFDECIEITKNSTPTI